VESGRGCAPSPPKKIFDDLILKWQILMHAYLRYSDVFILSSAVPAGRGGCAPSQKIFDYY